MPVTSDSAKGHIGESHREGVGNACADPTPSNQAQSFVYPTPGL